MYERKWSTFSRTLSVFKRWVCAAFGLAFSPRCSGPPRGPSPPSPPASAFCRQGHPGRLRSRLGWPLPLRGALPQELRTLPVRVTPGSIRHPPLSKPKTNLRWLEASYPEIGLERSELPFFVWSKMVPGVRTSKTA